MQERLKDILANGAIIAVFIYIIIFASLNVTTHSACLKAGYRSADVDFFLNRYCVTRTGQTDLVVPFKIR